MQENIEIPEMVTVIELSKRSGLSQYYIRQLLKKNCISHVKCGKKYLINVRKFSEFLENGE